MKIIETKCPHCGKINKVELNEKQEEQYKKWQNGEILIQGISLPADKRELLLTGICSECWDSMFKEDF